MEDTVFETVPIVICLYTFCRVSFLYVNPGNYAATLAALPRENMAYSFTPILPSLPGLWW